MNGNYLLDTNIVIALFSGEENVIKEINNAKQIFLPFIVIGELFYGALNSTNIESNINNLNEFCRNLEVVTCDFDTCLLYGKIKKQLKDNGTPIPENDIWIASIASQHKLPLVTRDIHFKYITNIDLFKW